MKQKVAVALLALTMVVGGLSPALAHDHAKKDEKKAEMKEDFFKHINATPDQKKKIEALDTQYKAKIDPLEKQMWDKKKSLMSYVSMPNSKKEEALKQEGEVVDLKSQIGQLYIEQAYTQKSYLTPEQQQKASEFYSEKMKEHEDKED
jgi:Spy/CpxP family protein refolding chaperone